MVGTHSREIEGNIFHLLLSNNFALEIERPAILDLSSGQPVVVVDGVQGWRNRNLFPPCSAGEALRFDSVKLSFDKGWSDPESNWRWSIGNASVLRFCLGAEEACSGSMQISCDTLGEQDISISLNNKLLASLRCSGTNLVIALRFDPGWIEKVNTLTFGYSNPRQPSGEDQRELAFCFRELVVT